MGAPVRFRGFGVWAWLIQMVSAAVLLVLALIHVISTHPSLEQQFYANVLERLADPLWLGYEIFFLALLTFHGFNGMRAIAYDLAPNNRVGRSVTGILTIGGIILFIFGTWVLLTVSGVL